MEKLQNELEKENRTLNGIITQLKKTLRELDQVGDTFPICHSNLSESHKQQECQRKQTEIKATEKKIQENIQKLNEAEKKSVISQKKR